MKENKYDDECFFEKYSQMGRSKEGLLAAGEWDTLQKLLPDLAGKRFLDLGCGYGWHCMYAMEQGANAAVGLDISEKMLEVARRKTSFAQVEYRCLAMEDMDFPDEDFDLALSSLALHYIEDFDLIAGKVYRMLKPGGHFVFSAEHPMFTAYGSQDWYYNEAGEILHFPVDRYFEEGKRNAIFLGESVVKYHKTLTTYLNGLLTNGFEIQAIVEPQPPEHLFDSVPGMREELRRPMMLLVSAQKSSGGQ